MSQRAQKNSDQAPKFTVIRLAVLMEDEGLEQVIDSHPTRAEAEEWIANQKNEYFKPSDYRIAEG